MTETQNNLQVIRSTLHENVELVAVSKFHPKELIEEAYACGQRIFGESREQELRLKHQLLPQDIQWHFIGHLQTNKVKAIVPYVSMIETADSPRLIDEIEKQASRINRTIDILLELHIADEKTKSGMTIEECRGFLDAGKWKEMKHIRIRGIMMMATNTDDMEQIRSEFMLASDFFNEIKDKHFNDAPFFNCRSYGMSNDYLIAQECNSNMVRVGSAIFGHREYNG